MQEQLTAEIERLRAWLHELEQTRAGADETVDPLRSSEERFRKIFDHSNDAIFVMDPVEDRIIDANPRACEMLGYSREELLTTVRVSDIHPHEIEKLKTFAQSVLQEGSGWTDELSCVTKHGSVLPSEMSASVLESGERPYLITIVRDVSERKRAEAAEREQRTLAEALRDTAAALNSTLDFDKVLERILLNVERVVPHAVADILLIDAGTARTARVRCVQPALQEKVPELELSVAGTPYLETMAATGQAVVIPDTRRHQAWPASDALYWVRSYVGAPILLDDAVIGFINLYNVSPGFFSDDHADRLQAFTDQASIAVQNARVHERAQEVATVEERQRIARELHDSVTQALSSANLIAQVLPRLWERDPDAALEDVADLQRLTQASLAEMRALLLELRPSVLHETDLNDLLQQLVDAAAGRRTVAVSTTFNSHEPLPDDVKIAFYRIAQEALNNATRHAQAAEISVRLCDTENGTELRIADDGRGFDPHAVPAGHFGVAIMRERAEGVGADLEIQSEAGTGTEVVAVWSEDDGE